MSVLLADTWANQDISFSLAASLCTLLFLLYVKRFTKHRRADLDNGETQFRIGPWWIDAQKGIAIKDQKLVCLSQSDIRLLSFLHRHPDQFISEQSLYEVTYERDYQAEQSVLDEHVAVLSGKLNRAGITIIIKTVEGQGYCFSTRRI